MTYDLTLLDDRRKALNQLHNDCKEAFISAGFESAPDCIFYVERADIYIGIAPSTEGRIYEFASDIRISSRLQRFYEKDNEISFGASGSFTPKDKASYWRTIHAASTLKLWDIICPIVDTYCKLYRELEAEIIKANNL